MARRIVRHLRIGAGRDGMDRHLSISRWVGDPRGLAQALMHSAEALLDDDFVEAEALAKESATIFQAMGDSYGVSRALALLANLATRHDDAGAATRLSVDGLTLSRAAGSDWTTAAPLLRLAALADEHGDVATARALYEEGVQLLRGLAVRGVLLADALADLGVLLLRTGHAAQSIRPLAESLAVRKRDADASGCAGIIELLAVADYRLGQLQHAARLLGAAETIREAYGANAGALPSRAHALYIDAVRGVRRSHAVAAEWAAGREAPAMVMSEVIADVAID